MDGHQMGNSLGWGVVNMEANMGASTEDSNLSPYGFCWLLNESFNNW